MHLPHENNHAAVRTLKKITNKHRAISVKQKCDHISTNAIILTMSS